MNKDEKYRRLYDEANEAGVQAVMKSPAPTPMVVGTPTKLLGNDINPAKGPVYIVSDGVCGFSWLTIKPANSGFAKWLVTNGLARKNSYEPGITISIHDYRQSLTKKETHAYAMAEFLRSNGINCYAESRID